MISRILKIALVAILAYLISTQVSRRTRPDLSRTKILSEYDYIVVGSGSSGGIVAARLAEDSSKRVLLIEAGPQDDVPEIHVPVAVPKLQKTNLDWQYETEPQEKACFGRDGNKASWPRGKVLGGSSVLNYMMYVRGHPEDYDTWAKNGCDGWSYKDVLPFFKKLENNEVMGNSTYHSTGGPVGISRVQSHETQRLSSACINAFIENGFTLNRDYNGKDNFGVSEVLMNIKNGKRQSTAVTYIWPAIEIYPNFHVLTEAHVTKVLIEDKKVVGVSFIRNNYPEENQGSDNSAEIVVKAKNEVIISGGAVNTPQLLMLSGIGPREQLEKYKIPVISDNPAVGKNLQDHIVILVTLRANGTALKSKVTSLQSIIEYQLYGTGLLSFPLVGLTAFHKFSEQEKVPEIQLLNILGFDSELMRIITNLQEKHLITMIDGFCIAAYLLHPKSTGEISLKSGNPMDKPKIQPNYLSDEYDLETMMKTVELLYKIVNSSALSEFRIEVPKPNGIPEGIPIYSKEYYSWFVKEFATTVYHPIGTAKMGRVDDPTTVVDSRLRVKGIKGLRVADCSVMPSLPSGNTNAPAMMIGEKAAQMIKEDNQ